MWRLEFQVDAARHNLFIAGSNRNGTEPPWGQPYFGDSHVAGPNGILPSTSPHPNLVLTDVDLDELVRPCPAGWNLFREVRPEAYTKR